MAPVPSSPPLILAVHRGPTLIAVSEIATEELAFDLAQNLARGGRWTTVRNGAGRLLFAKNSAGEIIDADHGAPADLHRWNRRIP